jgi:hypothetical protein
MKYKQITHKKGEYSTWFESKEIDKIACCDCGLVHDFEFKAVLRVDDGFYEIESDSPVVTLYRLRRNNRSTGQIRRNIHKEEVTKDESL